jgi:hypothetical protein
VLLSASSSSSSSSYTTSFCRDAAVRVPILICHRCMRNDRTRPATYVTGECREAAPYAILHDAIIAGDAIEPSGVSLLERH